MGHKSAIIAAISTLMFSSISTAETYFTKSFLAPKDIWAFDLNIGRFSVSSQYDNDGNQRSLSDNLTNSLPGGIQTTGSLRFEGEFAELTGGYGLTDTLSLGFRLPVVDSCSKVSVQTNTPLFTGEDLVNALEAGLTEMGTFGTVYSDADSHCISGIIAPIVGISWRIYESERDNFTFLPGVRLGRLTDENDPDVLFLPIIDDGSNDLILRADYNRDLGNQFDISLRTEYNIQFEDDQTVRADPSPFASITTKETLKRDLGDFGIFDLELGYRFFNDQLRTFVAYYRKEKGGDKYRRADGSRVFALEEETRFLDEEYRVGVYWDGIPSWKKGAIPLPLRMELNYWESFAGKNAVKYYFTEFHLQFAF